MNELRVTTREVHLPRLQIGRRRLSNARHLTRGQRALGLLHALIEGNIRDLAHRLLEK